MIEPPTAADYVPFNHDCPRCEHEPVCNICLKVLNKVSYQWFGYLKRAGLVKREHLCRQGRKRRNVRQMTIGEILEKRQSKHAMLPEVV
jgi:hypothetical protein